MQIKTIMKYHLTTLKDDNFQNKTESKKKLKDFFECWSGCKETGTLSHCWWECNMVLWETIWMQKVKSWTTT